MNRTRTWSKWQPASAASVTWTSGGIATSVTSALFAAAFVAMTTTQARLEPRLSPDRATVVELMPPQDVAAPAVSHSAPTPRGALAAKRSRPRIPQASEVSPITKMERARDTSVAAAMKPRTPSFAPPTTARSLTQSLPMREIPTFGSGPTRGSGHAGAPMAPAGVTMHSRTISTATRDSIATEKLSAVPVIAASTQQTPEAKEELRRQMEPGLPAYGRAARLPGYAASVPLMNGGYSIAITAVSTAGHLDRTARDGLDADYQRRLRRLQDRALLRRDSITADALRTDSLPRKP